MKQHIFDIPIFIGMFLGYSLLQLLEYCVAVIMTQMERFHEFLSKKIADRKGEMDNNQDTVHNDQKDSHVIELDQEAIRTGIDWEEKFKIMD